MEIGGLQKTSLIDYPKNISCVVFLAGCNFRCPWCYSSELVLPDKIIQQPKISEEEFFTFLKSRKNLLEGVVVCGGEPTINADLGNFIKKIKEMGFKVKLDTNGSNPNVIKSLLEENLLDYIAMDIKAPLDKESYEKSTGVSVDIEKIKESIEIIKNSGIEYEFRTTVVPTIHEKEDIIKIAEYLSPVRKYFLQSFRPEKTISAEMEQYQSFPIEFLEELAAMFDFCEIR